VIGPSSQNVEQRINVKVVSVVGLGRLGAPMVACLAAKGYRVIGVDVDPRAIRQINEGVAPVYEPGLDELLRGNRERIFATDDYYKAIAESQITFIVVPTPTDEQGGFSLKYVMQAAERIGHALREKTDFHLVVLTSTVLPGSSDQWVRPILETHSRKRCAVDFGFCYNPEFIALGSVIRDLLNPDFILIGESDARSGKLLAEFHRAFCDNNPPIARMNFVNAELTKIALNSYVTLKISYANMLAEICERLPGAKVDVVTSALGLDSRIGSKYLKGAIGYGGPCFPRDNVAFAYSARQLGTSATLAEASDAANRYQIARLEKHVLSRLPQGGTVGILGLSYKPETNVVDESQGVHLANSLMAKKIPVVLYDPAAMENARKVLGSQAVFASSLEECVRQAAVIVITTPWDEFKEIPPAYLVRPIGRPVLVDCWRIVDPKLYMNIVQFVPLGEGPTN
jgi:UDPglucose 6-dehydrogenase